MRFICTRKNRPTDKLIFSGRALRAYRTLKKKLPEIDCADVSAEAALKRQKMHDNKLFKAYSHFVRPIDAHINPLTKAARGIQ